MRRGNNNLNIVADYYDDTIFCSNFMNKLDWASFRGIAKVSL